MRADRLLSIIMRLQTRGKMTAKALAEELGVSRRTILRDVEALSLAGIPIYAEGGHGGGIALDENYRVSLTGLKESEVRSLFVASNAALLKDIGLGEAAENSLLKLFTALPSLHQKAVEQVRQRILIDPLWWWHEAYPLPFWNELQTAVYEDRCIRAKYEHYNGDVVERILEPYSLVAKASLWYLIARREGQFRTYRVSRFHDVVLLDSYFERQEDFDLARYWQNQAQEFLATMTGFTFTLRIDSHGIPPPRWNVPGQSEVLETLEGGWITVRFKVDSLETAKTSVIGFGKHATVIEPPELREAVCRAAREILERSI